MSRAAFTGVVASMEIEGELDVFIKESGVVVSNPDHAPRDAIELEIEVPAIG